MAGARAESSWDLRLLLALSLCALAALVYYTTLSAWADAALLAAVLAAGYPPPRQLRLRLSLVGCCFAAGTLAFALATPSHPWVPFGSGVAVSAVAWYAAQLARWRSNCPAPNRNPARPAN